MLEENKGVPVELIIPSLNSLDILAYALVYWREEKPLEEKWQISNLLCSHKAPMLRDMIQRRRSRLRERSQIKRGQYCDCQWSRKSMGETHT